MAPENSRRRSRADRRRNPREQTPPDLVIKTQVKKKNLLVWVENPIVTTNRFTLKNAIEKVLSIAANESTKINRIIINMEKVPYADSSAMGMFLELHKEFNEKGISFILFRVQPRLKEIMEIVNVHRILDVRDH